MGLLDKLKPKKEEQKEAPAAPQGKYSEACAACGGDGTDRKWMGQYWHKKCIRAAKKASRKMF